MLFCTCFLPLLLPHCLGHCCRCRVYKSCLSLSSLGNYTRHSPEVTKNFGAPWERDSGWGEPWGFPQVSCLKLLTALDSKAMCLVPLLQNSLLWQKWQSSSLPRCEGNLPVSWHQCWDAFYRVWSAVRVHQLQAKILHLAGSDIHGGVHKRGTRTALTEPLCELQRTQSLQANGIPMAQIRPGLRFLGTAGLTKAFDKHSNSHAAASALRLGLPKHVVKAWSAAWKGQRRILHMRHSCSSFWVDGIGNLPPGDLAPLDSCVVSSRPLIVLNNGSLISLSLPNVPGRQILVLQQAVNLFTDC